MLDEIVSYKRAKLSKIVNNPDYDSRMNEFEKTIALMDEPLDFEASLKTEGIRIISEVKKASPSKGVIRENFNPIEIAKIYESSGAAAMSVLTDEKYFQGSLDYLKDIRTQSNLPILRKDFTLGEYDIYEARAAGADAVLLIAAILEEIELNGLLTVADRLGMTALVEVHDEEEMDAALGTGATVIGVNNRDLSTFNTDIETTKRLATMVPSDCVLVSESGINTPEDIRYLKDAGANAFLIGEALMREDDIGAKLKELIGSGIC